MLWSQGRCCRFIDIARLLRQWLFYEAVQYLYDEEGRLVDSVLLEAGGDIPAMNVESGQWHRLESLESGTVIVEFKNGAYEPISPEDIMICLKNA